MAELIEHRREEEALQAEAEARLEAEQAARAEEDARLRELYPIEEDELEDYGDEQQPIAEAEAEAEPAVEAAAGSEQPEASEDEAR